MAQVGARGFPGFVLETEGTLQVIDLSTCLGDPDRFVKRLTALTEG